MLIFVYKFLFIKLLIYHELKIWKKNDQESSYFLLTDCEVSKWLLLK